MAKKKLKMSSSSSGQLDPFHLSTPKPVIPMNLFQNVRSGSSCSTGEPRDRHNRSCPEGRLSWDTEMTPTHSPWTPKDTILAEMTYGDRIRTINPDYSSSEDRAKFRQATRRGRGIQSRAPSVSSFNVTPPLETLRRDHPYRPRTPIPTQAVSSLDNGPLAAINRDVMETEQMLNHGNSRRSTDQRERDALPATCSEVDEKTIDNLEKGKILLEKNIDAQIIIIAFLNKDLIKRAGGCDSGHGVIRYLQAAMADATAEMDRLRRSVEALDAKIKVIWRRVLLRAALS